MTKSTTNKKNIKKLKKKNLKKKINKIHLCRSMCFSQLFGFPVSHGVSFERCILSRNLSVSSKLSNILAQNLFIDKCPVSYLIMLWFCFHS